MQDVNKKILWLADFDLDQAAGGAQRSDKILIDHGKSLGFDIFKVNQSNFGPHINLHDYDILISSNICSLHFKNNWLLDEISKHKHHIRIEHDSNNYLTNEQRKKLFSNCKKTFFLTEYHHEYFVQDYGDIFHNVEIVPDPIDTDLFCDIKKERENKILYAGYMHPLKGSYEFFDFVLQNTDLQFVVSGWTNYPSLEFLCRSVPNVEYIGITDYSKMPEIYNKYSHFYYNPNLKEPFCRSFAEAFLCGCKIISNKVNQIGSYQYFVKHGKEKFKNDCKNAHTMFWSKI